MAFTLAAALREISTISRHDRTFLLITSGTSMCSNNRSPSRYDGLEEDEIRVLFLEPGSLQEPLMGELGTAAITPDAFDRQRPSKPCSSVRYEAVSYAWESLDLPRRIYVRNIGAIAITASLFDILSHLRYVHRCRRLWVDGICIDQADVSERNHQVAKMADIFSASTTVLVWLGAEENTDSLALATIGLCKEMDSTVSGNDFGDDSGNKSGKDSLYDKIDLQTLRDTLCQYAGPYAAFRSSIGSQEDVAITALKSVSAIFQAKWFERLWVVQETNGLRDVVCFRGYHAIANSDLAGAFVLLNNFAPMMRSHGIQVDRQALLDAMELMSRGFQQPGNGGDIMSQFLRYSDRRCRDPRDRVYALRQTLGLERFDELRPDYQLDYVEIFRRLICVCLNLEKSRPNMTTGFIHPTLALALVGTEVKPRSNPNSPSWVPCLHELTSAAKAKLRLYGKRCSTGDYVGAGSPDDVWLAHGKLLEA